jgi:hypothetical protein
MSFGIKFVDNWCFLQFYLSRNRISFCFSKILIYYDCRKRHTLIRGMLIKKLLMSLKIWKKSHKKEQKKI